MKTYYIFIWLVILPFTLQAQYTWERYEVSATGGQQSSSSYTSTTSVQHYEANQNNNSTYSGNTGFLFPQTIHLDIVLDVKVYLEGPFNGTAMNIDLNNANLLPLLQPFNTTPWNYAGEETVVSIPNSNVVDWILIEIRDSEDAASATPTTIVDQQAAFLLMDGSVVGLDGSSILAFNHSLIHSLFIVIHHRNHLSVMSATSLDYASGVFPYNFSENASMAYLSGQKTVNGKAAMYGGDVNADGTIDQNDGLIWKNEAGNSGYLNSDANLNGQSDNKDKNDIWIPNNGKSENLPE